MIAVAYSKTTGRVRRWITDARNLKVLTIGPGEGRIEIPPARYGNLHDIQAYVTEQTGLTPTDDRYAVIDDKGDVIASIHACPDCDNLPASKYVKHAEASRGWKRNQGGEFEKPITDEIPDTVADKP